MATQLNLILNTFKYMYYKIIFIYQYYKYVDADD